MDLVLVRTEYRPDGIFGDLYDTEGNFICVTLEHAYAAGTDADGNTTWGPKVALGAYQCVRHAPARLPYETFELQKVPPFQGQPVAGILIHRGNFDRDSEGCILVGQRALTEGATEIIVNSAIAFEALMNLQKNVDSFQLTITARV